MFGARRKVKVTTRRRDDSPGESDDDSSRRGDRGRHRGDEHEDTQMKDYQSDDERRFRPLDDRRGDRTDFRRDDTRDDRSEDRRGGRGEERFERREERDRKPYAEAGMLEAFLPSAGIEWEVISNDIQIYLGPEATVEPGVHHRDKRTPGYWITAKGSLTQPMIEDLKADTIRWRTHEARKTSYASTATHTERQKRGPTSLSRAAPPTSRHVSSPMAVPGTRSAAAGYTPASMSASPPSARGYLTREDAEQIIASRLKSAGRGVTRTEFDQMIDEAMRRQLQSASQNNPQGGNTVSQGTQATRAAPPTSNPDPTQPSPDGSFGFKGGPPGPHGPQSNISRTYDPKYSKPGPDFSRHQPG